MESTTTARDDRVGPRPEGPELRRPNLKAVDGRPPHRSPSNARDEGALRIPTVEPARKMPQASKRFLTAFHGVVHPTTLAEAGSDLHRVYLTRLCCTFRLSQPLDALFRLQPFQPCFMPVTPLGFRFQRFSLPSSGVRLSTSPFLHAVVSDWVVRLPGHTAPSPDFKDLRT